MPSQVYKKYTFTTMEDSAETDQGQIVSFYEMRDMNSKILFSFRWLYLQSDGASLYRLQIILFKYVLDLSLLVQIQKRCIELIYNFLICILL